MVIMGEWIDEPLFDTDFTLFEKGSRVVVTTIWGEESGIVTDFDRRGHTFPYLEVALDRGDTITIGVGRVKPA